MKLFLLNEIEHVDVLCVQETWMEEGAMVPVIPGFKVVEQRQANGTRGGVATYYRNSLRLEYSTGNEYGIFTYLILPTSQWVNIVNVYLPPLSSLLCRNITEVQATTQLEEVMEQLQP